MKANNYKNVTSDNIKIIQTNYEFYHYAPIACFTLDPSGLILNANPAGAELLGIPSVVLNGKKFSRYISSTFQHAFLQHQQKALAEDTTQHCELQLTKKNGMQLYVALTTRAIKDEQSKKHQLLVFISDISKQKNSESQMRAEQLKVPAFNQDNSLDHLMDRVSTELNQPLSVISNYLNGCIRKIENKNVEIDQFIFALKKSTEAVTYASQIIQRMKNMICKRQLSFKVQSLNAVIQESINLIKIELINFPVKIYYEAIQNEILVNMDQVYIQEVILNIMRNAIEAMQEAHTIRPRIMIETTRNEDNILITISDNGPGFPNEAVNKLFDPAFSTKAYGSGMGLMMCRNVIEAHGGELFVHQQSREQGACFKFSLPLHLSSC